jgi:hypothetical protein
MSATSSVISHAMMFAVGAVVGMGGLVLLFAAEARGLLHEPSGEIPEEPAIRATATVDRPDAPEPTEADDDVAARMLDGVAVEIAPGEVPIVGDRLRYVFPLNTEPTRQASHQLADLLVVLLTQLEIHGKRHGYGQTAANMVQLRLRAEALRAELSPAQPEESPV